MDVDKWTKNSKCTRTRDSRDGRSRVALMLDLLDAQVRGMFSGTINSTFKETTNYETCSDLFHSMFDSKCVTILAYKLQLLQRVQQQSEADIVEVKANHVTMQAPQQQPSSNARKESLG
jgi:hypothetical protein